MARFGEGEDALRPRRGGAEGSWALEVIDDQGTSTAWDDTFPTEQDAYIEFQDTLQREGIRSFLT